MRVSGAVQDDGGDGPILIDQLGLDRAEAVDDGGGPEDADAAIDGVDDVLDREHAAGGVGVAVDGDFDVVEGVFDGVGHIDLHAVAVSLDRDLSYAN